MDMQYVSRSRVFEGSLLRNGVFNAVAEAHLYFERSATVSFSCVRSHKRASPLLTPCHLQQTWQSCK